MNRLLMFFMLILVACNKQPERTTFLQHNPSEEFITNVKKEVADINTDTQLQAYLEDIYALDQKYRFQEKEVLEKYGHNSEEYYQVWEKINKTDAENLVKVECIFDKFGYPDFNKVGKTASGVPWAVIHHSTKDSIRYKHFKTIYTAYEKGHISGNQMDFYLGRMYQLKFGNYFKMPSPYREEDKIDTLIQMLGLQKP